MSLVLKLNYQLMAHLRDVLRKQKLIIWKLEDWDEQLKRWAENPSDLSKDESTHAGITLLANRLLGIDE